MSRFIDGYVIYAGSTNHQSTMFIDGSEESVLTGLAFTYRPLVSYEWSE